MIKVSIATAAVIVAACSSPEDVGEKIGVAQGLEAETAQSRTIEIETEAMKFTYSWPAEAAAIVPLNGYFEAQAKAEQDEFEAMTIEAKADAEQYGYPYRPFDFSKGWEVAADTPGFLSLAAGTYTYTGGAHGNSVFDSMLWDRKSEEAMPQKGFFVSAEALESAVRDAYCEGLVSERFDRTGGSPPNDVDIFDGCPALEELVIVLGSTDGSGFDTIQLLAAPYVAGPYAEGSYEVTVPVTQAVIDAAKPDYRAAFNLGV